MFISYSHKDEDWKDRILVHLGIAQKQELFDVWDDRRIEGGEDWFEAITGAVDAGRIGILLVSANSLTSNFILKEEVPLLLDKRGSGKLRLYPIIIKPCNWRAVEWLKKMNLRPKDGRPLGLNKNKELTETQIDLDLTEIAEEIDILIGKIMSSASSATDSSQPAAPAESAPLYVRVPTLPPPKLFAGRNEHLARIEEKLRSKGAVGLISLRGTAGVGKSALALESAYRFGHLFPDGRYWVDLRAGDAANAVRALLRDLDVSTLVSHDSGFEEMLRAARSELASKSALVILDNAEAIDSTSLERLIEMCPTAIVTSRTAIDTITEIFVDKLSDDDALAMMAKCRIDVVAQRDDALKLTARLGGLALALEITARRMATYTPRQSCASALEELNGARHLVEAIRLPRHDTREGNIAEAFALSYRKLDDDLESAFHALGLCAESGAPLEAVARMLDIEPGAARDLLLVLAEWSLAGFSGPRAVLHPLLHSYAAMCAHQQPERAAEMIRLHVRYFGGEIGSAFQRAINEDKGMESDEAMSRIDREVDNVTLAQTRALDESFTDHELAVELTDDLSFYWRLRDEHKIFEWLLRARQLAQQTGQKQREANVLQAIGDVQSFRKEMDAALSSYDEALKLFTQVGAKLGQANVLKAIGDVQSFRDDKDAALSSYDEALKLFTQVGAKLGQANARLSKGKVINAAEEFEEAIRLYEEIGDTYSIALGKAFYGEWLLDQNATEQALKLLGEAREGFARINFEGGVEYVDKILKQAGDMNGSEDE